VLGPQNDPRESGARRMARDSTTSVEGNRANVTSLERAFAGKAKLPTISRKSGSTVFPSQILYPILFHFKIEQKLGRLGALSISLSNK